MKKKGKKKKKRKTYILPQIAKTINQKTARSESTNQKRHSGTAGTIQTSAIIRLILETATLKAQSAGTLALWSCHHWMSLPQTTMVAKQHRIWSPRKKYRARSSGMPPGRCVRCICDFSTIVLFFFFFLVFLFLSDRPSSHPVFE